MRFRLRATTADAVGGASPPPNPHLHGDIRGPGRYAEKTLRLEAVAAGETAVAQVDARDVHEVRFDAIEVLISV